MGRRYVKQPNGLYAEFSTITDLFVLWNATREEIIASTVDEAVERAKEDAEKSLRQADIDCPPFKINTRGNPGSRWAHALKIIGEVHGKKYLDDFIKEYELENTKGRKS